MIRIAEMLIQSSPMPARAIYVELPSLYAMRFG